MKVFLTGSGGFLGSELRKHLIKCPLVSEAFFHMGRLPPNQAEWSTHDDKYVQAKFNLLDKDQLRFYLREASPDVIFHLAGNPSNSVRLDSGILQDNVVATANLLELCPRGTRFVFASTANVYGNVAALLNEKCDEHHPTEATSVYTATKLACESLVEAYSNIGKITSLCIRYCAHCGCNATHGAVRDIFNKLKNNSGEIDLYGDYPGSVKPFIHVIDSAVTTCTLGLNPIVQGKINVSTDDSISICEVVDTIHAELTKDKYPQAFPRKNFLGPAWIGDNPIVRINNSLMYRYCNRLKYSSSKDVIATVAREMLEKEV